MARRNFSPKTKREVAERSGGVCEVHLIPEVTRRVRYPGLPMACIRKARDVDHIHADWSEGLNTIENAAHLCVECHKIKTKTDNREAKKSTRLRGELKPKVKKKIPSRPLQSRPFEKRK